MTEFGWLMVGALGGASLVSFLVILFLDKFTDGIVCKCCGRRCDGYRNPFVDDEA